MNQSIGAVHQGQDVQFSLDNVSNGAYIVRVVGENINETFRLLKD